MFFDDPIFFGIGQNYFCVGQMRLPNIPRVCLYNIECSVMNHDRNTLSENSIHLLIKNDKLMTFDTIILCGNFDLFSFKWLILFGYIYYIYVKYIIHVADIMA